MNPAEIIIIADGEATACCTEAPDLHTQIRYLAQGLSLAYGDQLTVEFLDLRQAPDHPLVRQVQAEGRRLPLLIFNREVKFEGGIPLLALKTMLERAGIFPRNGGESR
ncbi:MAG TPA: hypothetical protein GXZ98_07145 [Firmicutes bacterium]|nr:hypothetical protein [Bacillota bacterium]